MNVVLLNENFKMQLLELISSVAVEHVLPQLEAAGREHYLAKLIPDIENCFASDTGRYIGILCNGSLIGACGFSTKGHIAQLFVRTSEQVRGVGTMLLNQAVSQCCSGRVTVNASINAVSYYKRQGFEPTQEQQSVNGISFLPMAKVNS
jgi:hypothetical protein